MKHIYKTLRSRFIKTQFIQFFVNPEGWKVTNSNFDTLISNSKSINF